MKTYYIYILANQPRGTLYIGITASLARRLEQHIDGATKSFSKKYQLHRLVYVEQTEEVETAINREKQLKRWHRQWKINLIETSNPYWQDLRLKYGMDTETSSA